MCLSASVSRRAARRAAALLGGLLLAGCAASGNQGGSGPTPGLLEKLLAVAPSSADTPPAANTPPPAVNTPPPAKHPGCGTPAQCKVALKRLVDNPKRGWVGQQQPPAAYTDGMRLFAYRALRRKLSCRELTLALNEIRSASRSLAGDVPGVSHDQVSRTRALNSQVSDELSKERRVRCKV